jgi:hypothetical protein
VQSPPRPRAPEGQFVGQVTAAEGPGVRVLSKHALESRSEPGAVNVVEVSINAVKD